MKFFIDTANINEIRKAWEVGYSVIAQLAKHPLTDLGIEKFLKDWEKVPKR